MGCNEGIRSSQADYLRAQSRSVLNNLQKFQPDLFVKAILAFLDKCQLGQMLDFFHAFTGFCSADGKFYEMYIYNHSTVRELIECGGDSSRLILGERGPLEGRVFPYGELGGGGSLVWSCVRIPCGGLFRDCMGWILGFEGGGSLEVKIKPTFHSNALAKPNFFEN